MSITTKLSTSPAEQYYTTAPVNYDWGWTTVLIENAGQHKNGLNVRLVSISDGYHADYQTARYGSGNFAVMTPEEFRKEVRLGSITETPEAEHIISLTRDFDLSGISDSPARCLKIAPFLCFKNAPVKGVTISFEPVSGSGLTYCLRVHGPRAVVVDKFNKLVLKLESALKES